MENGTIETLYNINVEVYKENVKLFAYIAGEGCSVFKYELINVQTTENIAKEVGNALKDYIADTYKN